MPIPACILLFRIGSFYEVLFEDAELVARELGLKLTDRPSGGSAPPVPQCGFAHHALDNFLPRLLGRGYRVAVCEEGEERAAAGRASAPWCAPSPPARSPTRACCARTAPPTWPSPGCRAG